jgi:RNA-directed DNA polymerase
MTGWANYHQSVVSKDIFGKLDHQLWNMLWTWAKRRHRDKSKSWIVKKYWHEIGSRKWVFSTGTSNLKFFSDTKIVRHPNVKLDKNPYLDMEYFDLRKANISLCKKVNASSNKRMNA